MPITLANGNAKIQTIGLVDSAATVSVLPYSMRLALEAIWDEKKTNVRLAGNLARLPSQPILLTAEISGVAQVELVFAWSRSDEIPLILGQYNFFQEFDVHFYRSRFEFEINPKLN